MTLPSEDRAALLGRLRATDLDAWRAQLRPVLRAFDGDLALSAQQLGVPVRTLSEWVARDPLLRVVCEPAEGLELELSRHRKGALASASPHGARTDATVSRLREGRARNAPPRIVGADPDALRCWLEINRDASGALHVGLTHEPDADTGPWLRVEEADRTRWADALVEAAQDTEALRSGRTQVGDGTLTATVPAPSGAGLGEWTVLLAAGHDGGAVHLTPRGARALAEWLRG